MHLGTTHATVAVVCALSTALSVAQEAVRTQAAEASTVVRLADIEDIARRYNPTLVESQARVDVSRGQAWQAGIWPNPFIGYQGEHIGVPGPNGKPLGEHQSLQVQQELITGRKRQLSRTKYLLQTRGARFVAVQQEWRVLNDVRILFYHAMAEQRLVEERRRLLAIARANVRLTAEMLNAGQANRPDLLDAEIVAERERLELVRAENDLMQSRVSLASAAGGPLPPEKLEGNLDAPGPRADWQGTLEKLWAESPEVRAAQADVARDQVVVQRERVQPIPNIFATVDPGYNFFQQAFSVSYLIGGYIPFWNKNQGTVYQAQQDLRQSRLNVERVKLDLQQRLGEVYARYETSRQNVEMFQNQALPAAKRAYELWEESYRLRRRANQRDVLIAARDYAELKVDYLHALDALRHAQVEIEGYLLLGGLAPPPSPTPLGHLNAIHQPQ